MKYERLIFPCPGCEHNTSIRTGKQGTTGRIRYRGCPNCGQSFTTYQASGQPEKLALQVEIPELRPYPEPKFAAEWERQRHQEWLAGLLAEVIHSTRETVFSC